MREMVKQHATVGDDSITLIINSPPYNVAENFNSRNDLMDLQSYLNFPEKVWIKYRRVSKPGGRVQRSTNQRLDLATAV